MADNPSDSPRLHNIYACLKYTMFLVNAVIFICGGVLLGLGLWIKFGSNYFVHILGSQFAYFLNVGFFCIAAGCIMCFLGFVGCYGAIKEKRFLLLIFLLIMLALFVSEIAAAVVVLAFSDVADSILKDKGVKSLKESYYKSGGSGLVDEAWDAVMDKFKCCGFFGYNDFTNSTFTAKTALKYPKNCCKNASLKECDGLDTSENVIYTKGCFMAILDAVKRNSMNIGIAAATITALELSSLIVALVLFVKLG
ncbi:tetraspanin-16 isoform X2 [Mixophyes fleayi]|uniref:tetraspanin-16 isoform X2 n=1 Tax=Mixophyes fleayi TaxID=3061075 RepID=UPI003F4DC388